MTEEEVSGRTGKISSDRQEKNESVSIVKVRFHENDDDEHIEFELPDETRRTRNLQYGGIQVPFVLKSRRKIPALPATSSDKSVESLPVISSVYSNAPGTSNQLLAFKLTRLFLQL